MPNDIAMQNMGRGRGLTEDVLPLDAPASSSHASRRTMGYRHGEPHDPGQGGDGTPDEQQKEQEKEKDKQRRRRAAGPFKEPRPSNERCYTTERGTGPLKAVDIFSLIANKMIGTGIYTAPASVFLLTGSKQLTLGLFGLGFFYSLISTFLYLDFAAAFPYTGGELVYISEMTAYSGRNRPPPDQGQSSNDRNPEGGSPSGSNAANRGRWCGTKRIFGDGLLAYVAYSILFIVFFNSGTNSIQTGRLVLLCVNAGEVDENGATPNVNRDLVRFIGIVVLTILCLIQYFSPSAGRKLSLVFAVVKILTLFALIGVAGNTARTRTTDNPDKSGEWVQRVERNPLNFAKATLAVLFSFGGWENATFVAGEVPRNHRKVLQKGFILAVLVVGVLCLAVASAVLDALSWTELDQQRTNVNYAPMLTGNGTAARRGWAVMSAISSLGSLNSIIYTFSRVKQAIGQADILPWSKLWKKDDSMDRGRAVSELQTRNSANPQHYIHKAPQGGLLIHWPMSVVVISGSSATPSTIESIGIPGYLQTYIHVFILSVLAFGSFRLRAREKALANPDQDSIESIIRPSRMLESLPGAVIWGMLWLVYFSVNGTILVVNLIPPYSGSDGGNVSFPGWGFAATLVSVLLIAVGYYFVFFYPLPRDYRSRQPLGVVPGTVKDQVPACWKRNPFQAAGVRAKFEFDEDYNEGLPRVFRLGRRWRITYSIEGDRDGENYDITKRKLFLYWFFGGDRLKEIPPRSFWEWLKKRVGFW